VHTKGISDRKHGEGMSGIICGPLGLEEITYQSACSLGIQKFRHRQSSQPRRIEVDRYLDAEYQRPPLNRRVQGRRVVVDSVHCSPISVWRRWGF